MPPDEVAEGCRRAACARGSARPEDPFSLDWTRPIRCFLMTRGFCEWEIMRRAAE
jgi:hypothetical protein